MRYVLSLLISVSSFAAGQPRCLIVKHASVSHQVWVSGANWQYVAGEFPPDNKWKSNIRDRDIRKYKKLGWQVVIVPEKYTVAELEAAKAECSQPKEQQ